MKNFKYAIDEIYEFFDEIIGSIVPGLYFCSYFIFAIFIFAFICIPKAPSNIPYISVFIFAVSYVLGTMFRRSNSRDPDYRSATFIYFNSKPHDDNDYAFVELISNEEFEKIIDDFKNIIIDNPDLKYDSNLVYNRLRKLSLRERLFSPKHEIKNRKNKVIMCSKPFVLSYIYDILKKQKRVLAKHYSTNKKKIIKIEKFIEKHRLEYYCVLYVDYPYSNLKNYLKNRGLNNLTKYVTWDESQDSSITNRSKSVICNMKIDIKHYLPDDYGQLIKSEAHIRFMNAMWYANKVLYKVVATIGIFSTILSTILFVVLNYNLLKKIYQNTNINFSHTIRSTVYTIKSIFSSVFGENFETEKLMVSLILLSMLSLAYFLFYRIIKHTIENNFHYQRIREIVTVLHLYSIVDQKIKKSKINSTIKSNNSTNKKYVIKEHKK